MAAYAALISVTHVIEQIQHHPRPPISDLDQEQVQSLIEKVCFLQHFLEGYNSHGSSEEVEGLERRIADAVYAAEDVIESHVVDAIHSEETSSADFHKDLQKVIEDLDLIEKELMEIKEKKTGIQDQLRRSSMPDDSSTSPPTRQNNVMVGFDDVFEKIVDKLIGQHSHRQIVPIFGMGGIGKTTLARSLYVSPLIKHHFDILAWVTISQNYSPQEIYLDVLCQENKEMRKILSRKSENELGQMLHKKLWGRRYLIIMDDIWSIDAWDQVNFFFPDYNNGSRIIMTTRLSNLASQLAGPYGLEMKLLSEDNSWNLFCKCVFGDQKGCPFELEKIGKKIAKNCRGLPLSVVVIGGLLAKSKQTLESWEYVAENLTSIVNLEDNERCLKILQMSYNELPVHLKPCFLYMGVFPEDNVIRVSLLIKLWVAEGFLKSNSEKSLEMVAEEYFKELIDRNLILVHTKASNGKIKSCNIHDLIWDLCLKQAQKENFFCVTRKQSFSIPQGMNTQRRIGIHQITGPDVADAVLSASLARSLICGYEFGLPLHNFRLLRILKGDDLSQKGYFREAIFQQVNSRLLAVGVNFQDVRFPSSAYLLWNLQTLIVQSYGVIAPPEIWKMPQLRHVQFLSVILPDPPSGEDLIVLENLQTLLMVEGFKCGDEVVRRIPNIKKLKIHYMILKGVISCYHVNNFGHLHKLQSLSCFFVPGNEPRSQRELLFNITFPHSLKKLSLRFSSLLWEDMGTKIGSLPNLEVLKLYSDSFIGPEWETIEGQFCCLKYLLISMCDELEYWTTDSSHFPCLEHLVLCLENLKEIPRGIGDIPTLQSIVLEDCSESVVISVKEILDEQEELGNDGLRVRVILEEENKILESLASPNFQVEIRSTNVSSFTEETSQKGNELDTVDDDNEDDDNENGDKDDDDNENDDEDEDNDEDEEDGDDDED